MSCRRLSSKIYSFIHALFILSFTKQRYPEHLQFKALEIQETKPGSYSYGASLGAERRTGNEVACCNTNVPRSQGGKNWVSTNGQLIMRLMCLGSCLLSLSFIGSFMYREPTMSQGYRVKRHNFYLVLKEFTI